MNGRLAALAEQAGYFIKFEKTGSDVTVVHTKEPGTDGDLALFAELIIKECVRHFNEDYQRDFDTNWREDLSKSIKQHFGVEE